MSRIADRTYLKDEQYKTSRNLQTRINLHRQYGINPYPWQQWVFDQLDLQPGMRILEVGCGPADLWWNNSDRIPKRIITTLGDLSVGMVGEAHNNSDSILGIRYLCLDAQAIPSVNNSFDLVIANHMLYHVPDIDHALDEFRRVLTPAGKLCAATNGIKHMQELHELVRKVNPDHSLRSADTARFTLENAVELAKEYFHNVELRIYEDHLKITEVEPLVSYVLSMSSLANFDRLDTAVVSFVENHIAKEIEVAGYIIITKSQGMVIGYA